LIAKHTASGIVSINKICICRKHVEKNIVLVVTIKIGMDQVMLTALRITVRKSRLLLKQFLFSLKIHLFPYITLENNSCLLVLHIGFGIVVFVVMVSLEPMGDFLELQYSMQNSGNHQ